LLALSLTSAYEELTDIEYLQGIPYLNETGYADYYFRCKTNEDNLVWQLNQTTLQFNRNEMNGTTKLFVGTNQLQIITTLLFVEQQNDNASALHSVLIISGPTNLINANNDTSLNCNNRSLFLATTLDRTFPMFNIIRVYSNVIIYKYLFSAQILNNSTTYFFVCGVNGPLQVWSSGGESYGFTTRNNAVGDHRTKFQNSAYSTLIDHQTNSLTSVLLLTEKDDMDTNITCSSISDQVVTITLEEVRGSITTPPTIPTPGLNTTSMTASSGNY